MAFPRRCTPKPPGAVFFFLPRHGNLPRRLRPRPVGPVPHSLMYGETLESDDGSRFFWGRKKELPGVKIMMMHRAPFAEISSLRNAKGKEKMMYDVTVGDWKNSERRKEPYRTLPGDLLILANGEPESVSDLQKKRIWNSLHKHANLDIIKEILYPDSMVKEKCDECSLGCNSAIQTFDPNLVSKLNESQKAAIMAAIHKMDCSHKSSMEQIWGPPGT
ncbi:hypothetical protein LXL04_033728 [Taraxacum kok-saghyz]